MSLPTFYIPPSGIDGDTAILDGDELRHARSTLRLKTGDSVRVLDGEGVLYDARIGPVTRDKAVLDILSRQREPGSDLSLTVGMGVVHGERFDWAIQKGTELGAAGFIPLLTERTEMRPDEASKRLERLRRVIVSACKQCGRARFPLLSEPVSLPGLPIGDFDRTVLFWEEERRSLSETASGLSRPSSCLMIIGPVGGLTAAEVDGLGKRGAIVAGLGPRVLRTETAVVAGVALLQYLWGDLG